MRNGRPCSCGCEECIGFSCSLVTPDASCDANGIVYLSFYEPFDETLQANWVTHEVTGVAGHGVPVTGNYLRDYVEGSGLQDPLGCARITFSTTVFTGNKNEGYADFGIGGGPYFHIEGSDVTLSLPSGSIVVDDAYQSGDRYGAYLGITNIPPSGNYSQELIVYKMRNKAFACNPPLEGSGVGAGSSQRVTPYGSGCAYTECTLYRRSFSSNSEPIYNIQDPAVYGIEESGSWEFDDICVNFTSRNGSRLLYPGISNIQIDEGTCLCASSEEACDFILDKPWFSWQIPCETLFEDGSTSTPCHSGQIPYMMWSAYDDNWLLTDTWRCEEIIPPSSRFVYMRTTLSSYEVDFKSVNWNFVPIQAEESYSCQDSTPFDGNGDCDEIAFSGYPCDNTGCYSFPFASFDDIRVLDIQGLPWSHDCGSVFYASGDCLQIGQGEYRFGYPAFVGVPSTKLTIPRDDYYSHVRYNPLEGGINFTCPEAWKVEKLAYGLTFDETYRWWTGNFRFLGGSGSTGHAGTLAHPTYFDDKDLSLIYKSGNCENYTMYIYENCNEQKPKVTILDADNNVFSDVDFVWHSLYLDNNTPIDAISNVSYINNASHGGLDYGYLRCQDGIPYPYSSTASMLTHGQWYSNNDFLGVTGVICPSSDCVQASGYYQLDLYGVTAYDLNVSDFELSSVPSHLMDCYGSTITRDAAGFQNGYGNGALTTPFCGAQGFGVPFNPSDYPSATCISVNDTKIYDLIESETVDLMWPASAKAGWSKGAYICPTVVDNLAAGVTNIPWWQGVVIGKIISLGFGAYDPLTGTTFSPDDYPITGFEKYKIAACPLRLFIDSKNNNFKAFVSYCGTLPYRNGGGALGCPGVTDDADSWIVPPEDFIKSESDMLTGNYFAQVTVLSENPLKLLIRQTFMAFGIPCLGADSDDGCDLRELYPYMIEVILEAPTII
jgi:hypothetical protein